MKLSLFLAACAFSALTQAQSISAYWDVRNNQKGIVTLTKIDSFKWLELDGLMGVSTSGDLSKFQLDDMSGVAGLALGHKWLLDGAKGRYTFGAFLAGTINTGGRFGAGFAATAGWEF